jgi:hypothetical protein
MAAAAVTELIVVPAGGALYHVHSGEKSYCVHAEENSCTCPHWTWRLAASHGTCKHISAVQRHLDEKLACPTCRGKGFLVPSGAVAYVGRDGEKDWRALPCVDCNGSGRMTDEQKRDLFR